MGEDNPEIESTVTTTRVYSALNQQLPEKTKLDRRLGSNWSFKIRTNPAITMCYRIVTHTLRCDMRPILSNGSQVFVDSFAQPLRCGCCPDEDIRPWLQCDSHACCMVTARFVWCPLIDTCNEVIEIHRYVQARPKAQDIWNWAVLTPPPDHDGPIDDDWCVIPALEESLFATWPPPHITTTTPLFRMALDNLITSGRLIVQTQMQLAALVEELAKRRALHDAWHGKACERVLNEWECVARRPIETGEAVAAHMSRVLALQIDMFDKNLRLLQMVAAGEGDVEELMMRKPDVVMRDE